MMCGIADTGEGPYRVNLFSFTNLSLRTRLLVTMGVVFIPDRKSVV